MTIFKLLIFSFIITTTFQAYSYTPEEGNITANYNLLVNKSDFSSSVAKNPYYGGFALVANGDLNSSGALEVAIIQTQKLYLRTADPYTITERAKLVHISMGYRHWFSSIFSASLAIASEYSYGSPQIHFSNLPPTQKLETSAYDTTEYGIDLDLQTELWSNGKYGVTLDTRYYYSFTPRSHEKANAYSLMIGLRYLIQEKYQDNSLSKVSHL